MLTFEAVRNHEAIKVYIERANESLHAMGYTEHSFPHVMKVADAASHILLSLGYSEREAELAKIAGYLHDIGNLVNRSEHAQTGAVMAFQILNQMGGDPAEIATVVTAIGNHDESKAEAVNEVAAALILADKTDVRRNRVRNPDPAAFDIHDRVNYAVTSSKTTVNIEERSITLTLTVDTDMCAVMDYFEIFLGRMKLCRRAAEKLGLEFRLVINEQRLL